MGRVRICVEPLPHWLDCDRLLGFDGMDVERRSDGDLRASGELPADEAARIAARLRGLGIGGRPTQVEVSPPLGRALVRRGRLAEARDRRRVSPGFSHPRARFDEEGRKSLTPEAIALELGRRASGCRVLDATAGLGGNAIGFARAGCRVTAVERDGDRLALARHNAGCYGVAERIDFRPGDVCALLADSSPELEAELLFVDPPWGQAYDKRRVTLGDLPLLDRLLQVRATYDRLWAKVPVSFDERSLGAPPTAVEAVFGVADGDFRRIKFLLVRLDR